jgi:hypothetical protein
MSEELKPFDAMWLLGATNGSGVKFGPLEAAIDVYADAIAGALTLEPELSGALPGAFRPRSMDATFSSFGYAELFFPRETALQRIRSRFGAELIRTKLLGEEGHLVTCSPQLAAKELVVRDDVAVPLSRIGLEAGQSLFKRFQPRTVVTEKTRTAEELIAGVRIELKAHRERTHTRNLHALETQRDQTADAIGTLLATVVDAKIDGESATSAVHLLEALLDPLPDVRSDAHVDPRNLVTEIATATGALDARLGFTPNSAVSTATRKRVREIDTLLEDQQLVADVLAPMAPDTQSVAEAAASERAAQLAAMRQEQLELLTQLPDVLFTEEAANNAARNAARDAEAARLAEETCGREQRLRDLFTEKPRAEQMLRETLEERRAFLFRKIASAVFATTAVYALPFALGSLLDLPVAREIYRWGVANLSRVHTAVAIGLVAYAILSLLRYMGDIAPRLRAARENLQRIHDEIEATDKAKNNAHNDELHFDYDVAHRRATLAVLRRTRDTAKRLLDGLRGRIRELNDLGDALERSARAASTTAAGLMIPILDDGDVDAWYERTAADRKVFFLEFFETCIKRSRIRHESIEEIRERLETYADRAFDAFRELTIADVIAGTARFASEAAVAQRLKRFAEAAAPLIEVRDDDIAAQQAMQRDTTLWLDASDSALVTLLRRRLPDAQCKSARDALRVHALSRVLHYPAYVLAPIEYYRAQYDPAHDPESADDPDLLPTELVLTGALRTAYEQVLLGRAIGVIRVRADGQLERGSGDTLLGDTHLAAAQRLASSESIALRRELEGEIAPRIAAADDIARDLRDFLDIVPRLSRFDRSVVGALIRRFGHI